MAEFKVGDSFEVEETDDLLTSLPKMKPPIRSLPKPALKNRISDSSDMDSTNSFDDEDFQVDNNGAVSIEHLGDRKASSILSKIALMSECRDALKLWRNQARQYLIEGRKEDYHAVLEKMSLVLDLRRQLHGVPPSEDSLCKSIIREIVSILEDSRRTVSGYIIPRQENGQIADLQNTSIINLVKLHQNMYDANSQEAAQFIQNKMKKRREIAFAPSKVHQSNFSALKLPVADEQNVLLPTPIQLKLHIKALIIALGEPMQLRINIFNLEKKQYIFEDYVSDWKSDGSPAQVDHFDQMKVIFRDLDLDKFKGDYYLVTRVYQFARLSGEESRLFSKKESTEIHRRPVGVGVMPLCRLLNLNDGDEFTPEGDDLRIYVCKDEANFPSLPEMIVRGSKEVILAPRAKGAIIGLTIFRTPFVELKESFVENVSISRVLSFSEQSSAVESRNDFYVNLVSAQYAQDTKRVGKNVQLEVRVIDAVDCQVLDACLSPSCSTQIPISVYQTCILYHANEPEWNEILRLNLPNDQFETAHILFLNKHISSKADKNSIFSFAWLPLISKDGTVIADGVHELDCYIPWKDIEHNLQNCSYLRGDLDLSKRKDTLRIETTLCSTTKTQIESLQSLFKWISLDENSLPLILDKFLSTQGVELVKYTREVLDTLILMLCKYQGSRPIDTEITQCCFMAILHVLDQMTGKFMRFRGLIDSYINLAFKQNDEIQGSHIPLLSAAATALNYAEKHGTHQDKKRYKTLTHMAKHLRYITKLAIASFKTTKVDAQAKNEFQQIFREFLVSSIKALEISQESLIGVKGFLLRSFPTIFEDLPEIYSQSEVGQIFVEVFEIIIRVQHSTLSLDVMKLIKGLLSGYLGSNKVCRKYVEPLLVKILQQYLNSIHRDSIDEAYLSIAILTQEINLIHSQGLESLGKISSNESRSPKFVRVTSLLADKKKASVPDIGLSEQKTILDIDVKGYFVILPELINFVLASQNEKLGKKRFSKVKETVEAVAKIDPLIDSFSCLITLLHMMDEDEFSESMNLVGNEFGIDRSKEFLMSLLTIFLNTLSDERVSIYPEVWVLLRLLKFQVITKILEYSATFIKRHGDILMIQLYLDVCISVLKNSGLVQIASNRVDPESLKVSQELSQGRYATYVCSAVSCIRQMWHNLGKQRVYDMSAYFISSLLFHLIVAGSASGQELGIEIFRYLLEIDLERKGSYNIIEKHTFDLLYRIALQEVSKTDVFFNILFNKIEPQLSVTSEGSSFCKNMRQLYQLIGGITSIPATDIYEIERTEVALRLINYLQNGSNRSLLFQYIGYLVDIHLSLSNYSEAALTLLIHARQLDWNSTEVLGKIGNLPTEKESDRKERLYNQVIQYLNSADEWERVIQTYEEVRKYYAEVSFDFSKVAAILKEEAKLFEQIILHERYFCVFFRVGFYGGFSANLAGKEFVYKGYRLESNIDFTNRIKKKYPGVFLQMSSDTPSQELIDRHKSIISVTTLAVSTEEMWNDSKDLDRIPKRLHKNIKKYLMNNNSRVFTYKKPVSRSKEDKPKNEFKDLWVLQTFIRTADTFSTIRRLEVVERKEIWITPIENATNVVRDKSNELLDKIEQVENAEGQVDVGPLSMTLNGIIDAAVNGGTKKYVEAFLNDEFSLENPLLVCWQKDLSNALQDQLNLLHRGLEVFGGRCGDALLGLHQHLTKMLDEMAAETVVLLNR